MLHPGSAPAYDPNIDQLDEEQAIHMHAKEWDYVMSLTLLLHHLVKLMHIQILKWCVVSWLIHPQHMVF